MRLAAVLLLIVLPAVAQAQPRAQLIADLAFSLGRSHALRQACEGAGDQYWRLRMNRMAEVEVADLARLDVRFNDGYQSARLQFPKCTVQSRAAERAAATHGKALASLLARPARSR